MSDRKIDLDDPEIRASFRRIIKKREEETAQQRSNNKHYMGVILSISLITVWQLFGSRIKNFVLTNNWSEWATIFSTG